LRNKYSIEDSDLETIEDAYALAEGSKLNGLFADLLLRKDFRFLTVFSLVSKYPNLKKVISDLQENREFNDRLAYFAKKSLETANFSALKKSNKHSTADKHLI
jgi:hypothetical protein